MRNSLRDEENGGCKQLELTVELIRKLERKYVKTFYQNVAAEIELSKMAMREKSDKSTFDQMIGHCRRTQVELQYIVRVSDRLKTFSLILHRGL